MIQFLKNSYRYFKKKNNFFWSVNWLKTYYFNFKMFPYAIARKLPVYFYGKVKLSSLKGTITIEAPIKKDQEIGILKVYYKDNFLSEHIIFASTEIKRVNLLSRIIKSVNYLIWGDV